MRIVAFLLASVLVLTTVAAVGAVDNVGQSSTTIATLNVTSPGGITGFFTRTSNDIGFLAGEVLSEAVDFFKSALAFIVAKVG